MASNNDRDDLKRQVTNPSSNRRRMLRLIGLGGMAGLAGCMGGSGGNSGNQTNDSSEKGNTEKRDIPGQGENTRNNSGNPSRGGEFVTGLKAEAATLNVFRTDEGATSQAVNQLFDGAWLRTGAKPGKFSPRWFESYEISDSQDIVEITLRDNLSYGDKWGQLTAEDYIYNINNIWTSDWYPYTYGPQFNVGTENKPVKYEKTGKYTIKEELPMSRPFWTYHDPLRLSLPAPKKLIEPYVEKRDSKSLDKDPKISTGEFNGNLGPWKLRDWNRQSAIVYDRNDEYYLRKWAKKDDRVADVWAEAPYFDTLTFQLFGEESTMRSALKSGEIQMADIAATKVDEFSNQNGIQMFEDPFFAASYYTQLNHRANGWEGLRNKKVRWAIANLYDRNFVVKNILDEKATTQGSLYPSWGPYYPEDDVKTFEGTVEKAKQLLEEGTSSDYGYSGDKFVGPKGNQLELKCVYTPGTIEDIKAQYLKKRLGKAGIKVTLETTNWSNLLKDYYRAKYRADGVGKNDPIGYGPNGQKHPSTYNYGPWNKAVTKESWDLMVSMVTGNSPVDPSYTLSVVYSEQGQFNSNGYAPSKNLEKMRKKAQTETSRDKAVDTIEEMVSFISREQPSVFVCNNHSYTGYRKKVQGIPESPAESYWTNQNWDHYYYDQ